MYRRLHRHLRLPVVILAVVGLALATAPAALAQNAGDEQYADPFGDLPEDQGDGRDTGSGNQAEPQAPPAPAPEAPAVAPATPAVDAPATSTAQQLPRTGLSAGVPAALGVALLGSGLLLAFMLGRQERLMASVTGRPDSILHRAPPRPARGRRR
jgi:hypothetical protein